MHCEFKELNLRMDSLHIEMSKIFTERGSSYNKEEKKRYPPHLCRLPPGISALRIHPLLDFSKQMQFKATKMQLKV